MKPFALLHILAALLISQSSQADDLMEGLAAYQEGAYEAALELLLPIANSGNVDVQHMMGMMYDQGRGTAVNTSEAASWFEKAADGNHAASAYSIAIFYKHGRGVESNPAKSFKYMKISAEAGYDEAQYEVGLAYDEGIVVKQDYGSAAQWYRKAIRQGNGHGLAMNNLGTLYEAGHGVEQDYTEACTLYLLSSAMGNASGYYNLGNCKLNGWDGDRNYGAALAFYSDAAKKGHVEAQSMLGYIFGNGLGVEQSNLSAYVYFFLAAVNGSEVAEKNLAIVGKSLTESEKTGAATRALELVGEWGNSDESEQ